MKRTSKILAALMFVGVAYGCGDGADTGMQTPPLGQGGMTGLNGQGATGSTWAPVVGGQGSSFGNAGTSGVGVSGGTGAVGGAAGMAIPTGGMGAGVGGMGAGVGGMGPTGGMGPSGGAGGVIHTSSDPVIPEVAGDCPDFDGGSITFKNLSGITVEAGAKPAQATAPMVFYWHGTLSSAGEYALMATAVVQGVKAEGGVLVSFNGTTGGDLLSGTSIFGASDLELVDQMVACAVRDRNVDPHRIYATGCSAGGLFSTAMAALRSNYVAAAAPNSGGFTFPQMFQSAYTPALMTVHGAPGSDVVGIDFSDSSATADAAFKSHGGFVVNCNHGGGHCGGGSLAPDIWEFFKAHPYGVDPQPSPWVSGGLPAGFNSVCEIF
jgi:dienelactone hydrolase